ncbi:chromosome segregation protein SMC [Hoyosella sp. YIM 151337]|uniref:chromosome segregation protein SMC n=1 Tax=Hoyosella sp. YIM 151337 TaxID=2992742 RepID=UPI0022362472|nr:chromosome segregation protein SMC [Hoyosella sp. YIM 151337]MCW4354505.1 chromosome segregation protein SMC [Hoyosella sp. YIM 151337]
MHLKSLTLKGFKSFASATTLKFEPGINCVVGPNGSGKSNVVDALAWVMGEQGAKALRGGKMDDVIFAGTVGRPALGRAEVTLTIDNSDGALPIDYTEVSVTRRVFRDGASEYEINGSKCRLMDVQELLSDSGIGREMHVIVGQGQLAQILESRPEDLRAYIEEAAGVLKHRRRKEKALRKLDAMQANLARLSDLTTELRRQLKPLARQADVARRAQVIQAELRDAKLRLAADDLVRRRAELNDQQRNEERARAEAERVRCELDTVREEERALSVRAGALAPQAEEASQVWFRLSAIAERVSATIQVARERARHLESTQVQQRGQDPEALEAQAERVAVEEAQLREAVEMAMAALDTVRDELDRCEAEAADAEREHIAAVRAVADRREGLARLAGKVENLRTRAESFDSEITRLDDRIAAAVERQQELETAHQSGEQRLAGLEQTEAQLDQQYERAAAALDKANRRVTELREAERAAGHEVVSLQTRIETLAAGLRRGDGPEVLLEQPGVDRRAAGLIRPAQGYEAAVATALGRAADGVVASSDGAAHRAIAQLRADGAARAVVLVTGAPDCAGESPELPDGAVWAVDCVTSDSEIAGAVRNRLSGIAIARDLATARIVLQAVPGVRVVTLEGDVAGTGWIEGGTGREPSALEVQAEIDSLSEQLGAARQRADELSAALSGAIDEHDARRSAASETFSALTTSDTEIAQVHEELARHGHELRVMAAKHENLMQQRIRTESEHAALLASLTEHEERLRRAQHDGDEQPPEDGTSERRESAARALASARSAEVEARLAVRTAEERAGAVRGKADGLRRAARAEREARLRAERAQRARTAAASVANAVADSGSQLAQRLTQAVAAAANKRDELARGRDESVAALQTVRTRAQSLSADLARLTDAVHRDEVARAEAALRMRQLEETALEQLGVAAEELIAEYGPQVPLPPSPLELHEYEQARERGELVSAPQPMPFDRAAQERRLKAAERDLATLGKVNPLALEEFAALEERYNFLSTQLEDVRSARKDLLGVVADVDKRILQLFTDAYYDVEREFGTVFSTLFPGGDGRLVLTEPEDMLATGIEVEARPPGKKVKRLSLLSGGEKSLTAVAMLVAIFRARPSPFYVMDEVEAALDDTNLRRLITLFEELRATSQLIVITHQKPTMEVADALYGVSMRGDGITAVVSQRLRGQSLGAVAAQHGHEMAAAAANG